MVDDQPGKLLTYEVYEAIRAQLGEKLIKAQLGNGSPGTDC